MGLRGQGGVRSWRNFWRWTTPDGEDFLAENGALLLEKQISLWQGRSNPVRLFALGDLRDATSDFDIGRTLGIGSCYYLGILENRRVVIKAIKYSDDTRIREDLFADIAILSTFHHRNIVKLVGCCLETKLPLLVYEYAPRRSLAANLHLWRENRGPETPSWSTRLRIAMGVADALTYLDCSTSRAMIHRDIKPANIMLDDDCTAKLAGFDVLFPMPLNREPLDDSELAGTMGYMDPDYIHTGLVTEKVDVYSFGQLLQDILTGIQIYQRIHSGVADPFFRMLKMENRLAKVRSQEKCAVEDTIADDVMLTREEYLTMVAENASGPESSGGKTKQLRALAELALLCCRYRSEERPGMKEVASELRRINGMELP